MRYSSTICFLNRERKKTRKTFEEDKKETIKSENRIKF